MQKHFNVDPWMPCIKCNAPMTVNNSLFDNFYFDKDITCPSCSNNIDFSAQLEKSIDLNFMNNNTYQLLGLPSKGITIKIKSEERKIIKFSDYGIPEDSRIVFINYTSQNGVAHPVQIHGNMPYIDFPQKEVALYPLPFPNSLKEESEVLIYIMWSENKNTEIKYLIDGFHQYNLNKYDEMIIPLNIAIESYITNIIFKHFEKIWDTNVAKRLIKPLDYSYIINNLLKDLASANNWIEISKDLRKDLTNLFELRNQVAHSGKTDKIIEKNDANKIVKSVLLAYHYSRIINETIDNYANIYHSEAGNISSKISISSPAKSVL